MRVAEYGASRRADVADLMGRVWGTRPAEDELAWFYERNPVRPASVLRRSRISMSSQSSPVYLRASQ